ncbi:hypothetical protein DL95DRAFT_469743 [Leptodontidium sp. 2 PMI_412]|nr:hypothetical protein DL95DRAFT_469743 [Leptodontidium sp. 2 PMI_412]
MGIPEALIVLQRGGTYMEALRAANRASDAEHRSLHFCDMEIDTGQSFCSGTWPVATQGDELRTSAAERAGLLHEPSGEYQADQTTERGALEHWGDRKQQNCSGAPVDGHEE